MRLVIMIMAHSGNRKKKTIPWKLLINDISDLKLRDTKSSDSMESQTLDTTLDISTYTHICPGGEL